MQQLPATSNAIQSKRVSSFQDRLVIVLFLAPALILFLLFVIYPIFRSIYFSLFDWNGLGPAVDFVGLDNFKTILTDKVFIKALWNGFLIIVFSLGLQLPLALALAVLVGRDLPGRGIFRTIFFLPYVLSEVCFTTPTRSAVFSTRSWFFSVRSPWRGLAIRILSCWQSSSL
jgi:raffinose/stachyose/melibiose transport system permease protein